MERLYGRRKDMKWQQWFSQRTWLVFGLALFALLAAVPQAFADDTDDLDAYKLRFDLLWFYSQPTGSFTSAGNAGSFNLHTDVGFNSYSTFLGKVDWKFTRKNHLYFMASNFDQSKQFTFNRTVVFQGQTFNTGVAASGQLQSLLLVPGYQYDFIRRKRWNLGAQVQLDFFDITASLSAAAQINNGIPRAATFSSGSIRAPLPVAGPTIRIYPTSRFFVTANVLGMYFFGYGNFVSTEGSVGFKLTKNFALRGGYSLGSHFNVNTKSDRIGVSLSQKGALAGLEVSF
jgi:hypothetical protein